MSDYDNLPCLAAADNFLLLHPRDNVLICTKSTGKGTRIKVDEQIATLSADIELGHKIARTHLEKGAKVFRYGIAIGSMSAAAEPGEHVHSHNLHSDYIPAHGRETIKTEEIRS